MSNNKLWGHSDLNRMITYCPFYDLAIFNFNKRKNQLDVVLTFFFQDTMIAIIGHQQILRKSVAKGVLQKLRKKCVSLKAAMCIQMGMIVWLLVVVVVVAANLEWLQVSFIKRFLS